MVLRSNKTSLMGVLSLLGAYSIWGILMPLYFKTITTTAMFIETIGAGEIMIHRILWSFLFVIFVLLCQRRFRTCVKEMASRKVFREYFTTGTLLFTNWFIYVMSIEMNQVMDSSLGYFISPLFVIILGFFFLGERLSKIQILSVLIAALGVLSLVFMSPSFPYIALGIAGTWSVYSLLRKRGSLGPLRSMLGEAFVMLPAGLGYLVFLLWHGEGSFITAGPSFNLWLVFAGVITVVPLLLFNQGLRSVPMSTVGILQYLVPTLLFLVSWLVFKEPLNIARLLAFVLIWVSVILYCYELWRLNRRPASLRF